MSHARVEEVSDSDVSDPEEMDLEDLDTLAPNEIIRQAVTSQPKAPQPQSRPVRPQQQGQTEQVLQPSAPSMEETEEDRQTREAFKRGTSLYPIYFDAARSKKEGRRVKKEYAVANPLAREIAEAAYELGYRPNLEPSKMHPKDWANPGRVRILGKPNVPINNKHHLYIKIAEWLKRHPTTAQTSLKMPVQGLPRKAPEPPAVPRGWKMNKFLPMHSPAVSGGGVSEDLLGDMRSMMQQMGGPGGPGMPGMPGMPSMPEPPQIGGSQKKKDKKTKK